MPGKPRSALEKIRHEAHKIRLAHPVKYGVKGRKKGQKGYVHNGWRKAIHEASLELYH